MKTGQDGALEITGQIERSSDGGLVAQSADPQGTFGWPGLDVELPANLYTHSRRQRFYFDPGGALVRHDYHAEIDLSQLMHFSHGIFDEASISLISCATVDEVGSLTAPRPRRAAISTHIVIATGTRRRRAGRIF